MSTPSPTTPRHRAGALVSLMYVLCFLASLVLPDMLGQNRGASLVTPYSTDAEVGRYLAETTGVPAARISHSGSSLGPQLDVLRRPLPTATLLGRLGRWLRARPTTAVSTDHRLWRTDA